MKFFHLRLSEPEHAALRQTAKAEERTMQDVARACLKLGLAIEAYRLMGCEVIVRSGSDERVLALPLVVGP